MADAPKIAAGTLYIAPDGDVLMLRRSSSEENYPGHWALPGGKADEGETAEQAADRESLEEIGQAPEGKKKLIGHKITPTGMAFHTFAQPVDDKFTPTLNSEHSGYCWSPLNQLPGPIHPALGTTLHSAIHGQDAAPDCATDMSPEDWKGLVNGFLKFIREEEREPEHQAADAGFEENAHPRAKNGEFGSGGGGASAPAKKTGAGSKGVTETAELSPKETAVISQYGEGNSYNVNKFLSDPKAGRADAKKNFGARAAEYVKGIEQKAKTIDGIIAKSKLKSDTELFRGVSDIGHIKEQIADLKPGESFSLPTFSSTSRSKEWAGDFMKGKSGNAGMIVINAKAGANALDMDEYARHKGEEQEVLLGRDTEYQFDKYDEKTNTVYVTVKGDAKQAGDAENPSGALTESEQAEAAKGEGAREEMPASAFLEPTDRKYPVREKVDGEWKYSRNLLLAASREARMHGHEDLAARADKIRARVFAGAQDSAGVAYPERFAFDRGPEDNRSKTVDGRLLVKENNISKANVCDYIGAEIPDWEALGLDPKKIYKLYRDPIELKKAAPTFNEVPLLMIHEPSTADDHPREITVGTTGSKTRFEAPYLKNSIAVWDGEGVEAVESMKKHELSPAYRYVAVMQSGTTPEGEYFDGRMTQIVGNHLCLVETGRTGPDVVVGDSSPFKIAGQSGDSTTGVTFMKITAGKLSPMGSAARGAIVASLYPVMAADKALDLKPLLGSVRKKTWAADKARIIAGLPALIKGAGPKLATDAEVGPIVKQVEKLLDTINPMEEGMDDDPEMGGMDDKKPWDAEDQKAYDELCARMPAKDADPESETEEERKARMDRRATDKAAADAAALEAGKNAMDETDPEKKPVTKAAMDAKLAKMAVDSAAREASVRQETIKQMRDTNDALALVEPLVGKIAIACDTDEDVFKHTLKSLKIAADGLPAAAMKVIVERELVHRGETAVQERTTNFALDSGLAGEIAAWEKENGIPQRDVRAV